MDNLRLINFGALGERLERLRPNIPGFYGILRLQSRQTRTVALTKRKPNHAEGRTEEGMGLQLFSADGASVFASIDDISADALEAIIEEALTLLQAHPPVTNALTADFSQIEPLIATRYMTGSNLLRDYSAGAQLGLLRDAHERLYALETPETRSMASSLTAVDDEWRIFRSDGTDVHFNTWRASFAHRITLSDGTHTVTVRESECGQGAAIILDPERFEHITARVKRKLAMGLGTLRGQALPAGQYNIILDAGMAKGLAHEAFGHSCESDRVLEGSALTRDGHYLKDEQVAPETVSIVDFAMDGDWADQPYSANGLPRQTVAIVKHGKLTAALADIFSGPESGLTPTGAERVERYDCVPLPRMSNIRLELADALSWDRRYGEVEAEELYDYLLEQGLIQHDEIWVFLEGYRGGQVNSVSGDYVFHCTAIHKFEAGQVTVHPPAIFSGQVLKTLAGIRGAVGPLEIMRQGMCGKDGQRVPSSGGGHLFTLFNAGDGIMIGGQ